MSLNGLSEDTTVSAGDGLSLSTAGVMTSDVLQSEVDAKQNAITAGTGLSFSGATLNAEATDITGKLDKPSLASSGTYLLKNVNGGSATTQLTTLSDVLTAGTNISFSGTTINATGVSGDISVDDIVCADVKASGDVGIGTSNPGEKLDLVGTMKHQPSGGGVGVKLFSTNVGGNNHRWTVQPYWGGPNRYETLLECDMYHERVKATKKMYAPQFQTYSDDRLKHNEQPLQDAFSVIEQLNPIIYYKSHDMYDANFTVDASCSNLNAHDSVVQEAGFIAQEVSGISELAFTVSGGDHEKMNEDTNANETIVEQYALNYNSIFTYNVRATQELLARVKALEDKIAALS